VTSAFPGYTPHVTAKPKTLSRQKVILNFLWVADEPQSVNWTCGRLRRHSLQLTDRFTFSPERAPSDFYLFLPLHKRVAGKRFESDTEVKQSVAFV
jgi:hypothetical protein